MPSDAALNIALTITGNDQVQAGFSQVSTAANSSGNILLDNRMAFRELGRGFTQLGTAALGVGIAMQESSNQAMQHAGKWVTMAGGIFSAVGASMQFITSIGTMIKGLKDLQLAEILTQAFSGWGGIAMLGVGAAAATGVVAYATHEGKAENKVTSYQTHELKLDSNVVSEQVRSNLIYNQNRNAQVTGIH